MLVSHVGKPKLTLIKSTLLTRSKIKFKFIDPANEVTEKISALLASLDFILVFVAFNSLNADKQFNRNFATLQT